MFFEKYSLVKQVYVPSLFLAYQNVFSRFEIKYNVKTKIYLMFHKKVLLTFKMIFFRYQYRE